MLNELRNKLKEVEENVFYGMVDPRMKEETVWNYIVFNRSVKKVSENKTGFTDVYSVHIVNEEYIPEGFEEEVISKVLETGMRVAGTDGTYDYAAKPNTNVVLEMFSIDFVKPKKKV